MSMYETKCKQCIYDYYTYYYYKYHVLMSVSIDYDVHPSSAFMIIIHITTINIMF